MEASSCGWCNIKISHEKIDFEVPEGWNFVPPHQLMNFERDGTGMSPRWTATADQEWLRLNPWSGSVPRLVQIGANSIGKPAGVYEAKLTIDPSPDSVTVTPSVIDVTLTVTPKEQPEPPEPPPPEPEPEPEPEPPPPDPEPDPDPDPEPDPDPDPEPPPEPEEDWVTRFLKRLKRIFDWLFDRIGGQRYGNKVHR